MTICSLPRFVWCSCVTAWLTVSARPGEFDEAIKWYTKAIEAYPQGHVYYSNRCACYTSLNQLDKALKDSEDCVRIKPDWSKGYYRLGNTLALLHRYEEAQTALKKGEWGLRWCFLRARSD